MAEYSFLAHNLFIEHLDLFEKIAEPKYQNSLRTQFQKCLNDPLRAGKPLHVGDFNLFGGLIYRLQIGGRKGYRLIYYANPEAKTVLGIYISTKLRKDLKYHKIGWEAIAAVICEDFRIGKNSVFRPIILE